MVFSDTTNKNGIIQQIEASTNLGDAAITGNATLFSQITAQVNNYYSKATNIIISSSGVWRWDDTSHTDLPSAVTDLVSGQSDYNVLVATPDSTQDWLQVVGVNVKDSGGKWYKLFYKSNKSFSQPKRERDVTSGQPYSYYFEGTQVFLDAEPNYNSTGGLEILFNRAPLYFATTDTTKRPGFNTLFHEYLVLGPTYWWEKTKKVGDPEQTKRDIMEIEKEFGSFYNNRNKYEPTRVIRAGRRLK